MGSQTFHFEVKVYYDSTDLNGHVNYASYMNYFSRAREEVIGFDRLANMINKNNEGIAVYNAAMKYRGTAKYGDIIDIRSTYKVDGEFKVLMHQEAWVAGHNKPVVIADFDLVCIDTDTQMLKRMPELS
jgi:acyl-CoA thioester hydrolase